ncbi:hypothetical protein Pelo_2118 [Pelomyxa schiedti]|nr:hypothetical protein Pelo_2118 [Pelomyxa schiedti]
MAASASAAATTDIVQPPPPPTLRHTPSIWSASWHPNAVTAATASNKSNSKPRSGGGGDSGEATAYATSRSSRGSASGSAWAQRLGEGEGEGGDYGTGAGVEEVCNGEVGVTVVERARAPQPPLHDGVACSSPIIAYGSQVTLLYVSYKREAQATTTVLDCRHERVPKVFIFGKEPNMLGLDVGLQRLRQGDRALINILPALTCLPNTPALAYSVSYLVWILRVIPPTEDDPISGPSWEKDIGTMWFRKTDFRHALLFYLRSISQVDLHKDCPDPRVKELRISARINCAICHAKMNQWNQSLVYAEQAAALDPTQTKSLFHASRAHKNLGHLKQAYELLTQAVNLAPKDKSITDELVAVGRLVSKEDPTFAIVPMRDTLSSPGSPTPEITPQRDNSPPHSDSPATQLPEPAVQPRFQSQQQQQQQHPPSITHRCCKIPVTLSP